MHLGNSDPSGAGVRPPAPAPAISRLESETVARLDSLENAVRSIMDSIEDLKERLGGGDVRMQEESAQNSNPNSNRRRSNGRGNRRNGDGGENSQERRDRETSRNTEFNRSNRRDSSQRENRNANGPQRNENDDRNNYAGDWNDDGRIERTFGRNKKKPKRMDKMTPQERAEITTKRMKRKEKSRQRAIKVREKVQSKMMSSEEIDRLHNEGKAIEAEKARSTYHRKSRYNEAFKKNL